MSLYRWLKGAPSVVVPKGKAGRGAGRGNCRSVLRHDGRRKAPVRWTSSRGGAAGKDRAGGHGTSEGECPGRASGSGLDALFQDVRYSAPDAATKHRRQREWPVLILALGIGANTALFGTVHAVLLKGLPFPEPNRLVIGQKTIKRRAERPCFPGRLLRLPGAGNGSFQQLAALRRLHRAAHGNGREEIRSWWRRPT